MHAAGRVPEDTRPVVSAIDAAEADIVGLQEPTVNTRTIAERLGWQASERAHARHLSARSAPQAGGRTQDAGRRETRTAPVVHDVKVSDLLAVGLIRPGATLRRRYLGQEPHAPCTRSTSGSKANPGSLVACVAFTHRYTEHDCWANVRAQRELREETGLVLACEAVPSEIASAQAGIELTVFAAEAPRNNRYQVLRSHKSDALAKPLQDCRNARPDPGSATHSKVESWNGKM